MPPAARMTDMHICPAFCGVVPHVGGPIVTGKPTVLTGSLPQATMGDSAVCACAPDSIVKGSGTVMVCNMPAARIGDSCAHGGAISVGMPTVIIGG